MSGVAQETGVTQDTIGDFHQDTTHRYPLRPSIVNQRPLVSSIQDSRQDLLPLRLHAPHPTLSLEQKSLAVNTKAHTPLEILGSRILTRYIRSPMI